MNFETVFFETQWNKRRLKQFLKKCTVLLGGDQTRALAENLKHAGYEVSTRAGLSLNIEDLKVPGCKPALSRFTRASLTKSEFDFFNAGCHQEHGFGFLTSLWNNCGELLKREVVKCFQNDDLLNPVFLMAFSGARGNLSQIRQLVGLRGLMTDPNNNVVPYGLTSNFREGLSLTEYIVSCSGARKGVIDTALRTATSGYLTRRLVDVAHHMVVERWDCNSQRSLSLPFFSAFTRKNKPGNFQEALAHRSKGKQKAKPNLSLLGRVLKQNVLNQHGQMCGTVDQEINMALLLKACLPSGLRVRSPCTCDLGDHVCRLCYGWNHDGLLVSLGECVGILACQSIGEPGTQLTMRTFHTGGVFSGESSNALYAPQAGFVFFQKPILGQMAWNAYHHQSGFLTKQNAWLSFVSCGNETTPVRGEKQAKNSNHVYVLALPSYSFIFAKHGLKIEAGFLLAELFAPETCFGHRQDVFAFSSPYEGVFLNTCAQVVKHEPQQRENAFWSHRSLSLRFGYVQPLWSLVRHPFKQSHREQDFVFEKQQTYRQTSQNTIPPDLSKKKKTLVTLAVSKTHRFDFDWAYYHWLQLMFNPDKVLPVGKPGTTRYNTWFGLTLDHVFDASLLHLKQIRWRFGFGPMGFSYRPDRNRFMSQFHDTRFWVLGAKKLNMLCDPCDLVFKPPKTMPTQNQSVLGVYALPYESKRYASAVLKTHVLKKQSQLHLLIQVYFEPFNVQLKTKLAPGLKRVFGKPVLNHASRVKSKRQKPVFWFKNQPRAKNESRHPKRLKTAFSGFVLGLKKVGLNQHIKPVPRVFKFVSEFGFTTRFKMGSGWTQKTRLFKHKRVLNVMRNQPEPWFAWNNTTAPCFTLKQIWFSCFLEIQAWCLNRFVVHQRDTSHPYGLSTKKLPEKRFASRPTLASRRMITLKNHLVFSRWVKTRANACQARSFSEKRAQKGARKKLCAFVFPCLSIWVKTRNHVSRKQPKIPFGFAYDQNTFWLAFKQGLLSTCGFDFFPFLNLCMPKRKKQAHLDFASGKHQKQNVFFQNRFSWCLAHPVFNPSAFLKPFWPPFSLVFEPGFKKPRETKKSKGLKNQTGLSLAKRFFSDLCGVWHMETTVWPVPWKGPTHQASVLFSHAVFAQTRWPFKSQVVKQNRFKTKGFLPFCKSKTQCMFPWIFKHGQSQIRKASVLTQSAKTPFWSHAYARYGFLQTQDFKQSLKTSFCPPKAKRCNLVQIQNGFKNQVNNARAWFAKTNPTKVDPSLTLPSPSQKPFGTGFAFNHETKPKPNMRFWVLKVRTKEATPLIRADLPRENISIADENKAMKRDGLNTPNHSNGFCFESQPWHLKQSQCQKERGRVSFLVQTGLDDALNAFRPPFENPNSTFAFVFHRQHTCKGETNLSVGVLQAVFKDAVRNVQHPSVGQACLLALARTGWHMGRKSQLAFETQAVLSHDEQTQIKTKCALKRFGRAPAKRNGLVFGSQTHKPLVFYEVLSKTRFANIRPDTVPAKSNTKATFAKHNRAFFEPRLHRVALSSSEHLFQLQPASLNAFCVSLFKTQTQHPQTDHEPPRLETRDLKKPINPCFSRRLGAGTLLPYGFRWQKKNVFLHGGQIWFLSSKTVILRQGRQFFMPQRCFSFKTHFDFVPVGSLLFRGLSKRVLRGDITQGILKVERLFEMRLDYDLNFGLREALRHGYHAWNGTALNVLVQRRVILKLNALAQTYALRQIQNVYMDVGVNILDKHVELILKQMTSRARIRRGFRLGFFSGDYVHLSSLNLSLGFCVLNPGLNGLTKTSFLAPGFLSPASFQETKSVLANRSFLAHDDFLSGLKENVICGRRLNMGLNVQPLFKHSFHNVSHNWKTGRTQSVGLNHFRPVEHGEHQASFKLGAGFGLRKPVQTRFGFRYGRLAQHVYDVPKSVSRNRILRHLNFMKMKPIR